MKSWEIKRQIARDVWPRWRRAIVKAENVGPGGQFLEGPEKFSGPESHNKNLKP